MTSNEIMFLRSLSVFGLVYAQDMAKELPEEYGTYTDYDQEYILKLFDKLQKELFRAEK